MNVDITITLRGEALIAAIDAGLLPKDENKNGWDTEAFQRFWDKVVTTVLPAHAEEVLKIIAP